MKRNQLNQNGYRIGVAGGRPGFTLVEMLTVIVIIGILAALISAATIYARARAREAAIYTQIKQLESALMEYKNQFGEFPPDFTGPNREQQIERHIRRRWPRFQIDQDLLDEPYPLYKTLRRRLLYNYHINLDLLTPDSALVFWLGGLPEPTLEEVYQQVQDVQRLKEIYVYTPNGFHADEENPIQPGEPRTGKFFEFDARRIAWKDGPPPPSHPLEPPLPGPQLVITAIRYEPGEISSQYPTPIVYFKPYLGPDGKPTYEGKLLQLPDESNVCIAYMTNNTEVWRNRDTFQLIHPGLDGVFGIRPASPAPAHPVTFEGSNFAQGDFDNITNFAPKLENEIE